MKTFKLFISILLLVGAYSLRAQNIKLYGLASSGNDNLSGVAFSLNSDGTDAKVIHPFLKSDNLKIPIYTHFIEASDGLLYGMTSQGGDYNFGAIFKISKDGSSFAKIHDFTGLDNGANPQGSLVEGKDGFLYGMTPYGGKNNVGTLFKIGTDGSGFTVLHGFTGGSVDGASPYGSLIVGRDSLLYGMTSFGGPNNNGTIFKISKDGTVYSVINYFHGGTDGSNPYGSLIEASDSLLYGMTKLGNDGSTGTLFKIKKDGSGYKSFGLSLLNNNHGYYPLGSLIEGRDKQLYGMTSQGGSNNAGTIFKVAKDGTNFVKLSDFGGTNTGANVDGSLIKGSDDMLYGMTRLGGSFNSGTAFKLAEDGSSFSILHNFGSTGDGSQPLGDLIQGSDGLLYGLTYFGGITKAGTMFKITTDGVSYTKFWDFNSAPGGQNPYSNLIEGSDGMLYGTTLKGGNGDVGTIFKFDKDGSGFQKLHDFSGTVDGMNPPGSLVEGSDGLLYGVTSLGGVNNYGAIFKIAKDGSGFGKLFDFDSLDGAYPNGSLIEGYDGFLYGMTSKGGIAGNLDNGTIFKISKKGLGFNKIHDFSYGDGATPLGSLIQGKDSLLYGMTSQGGNIYGGTIFKMRFNGSSFTNLHSFSYYNDAETPYGSLLEASDGYLYGMTRYGSDSSGKSAKGAIFKISKDGSKYSKVYLFALTLAGSFPQGDLTEGSDGFLYGMCSYGGASDNGTVFKIVKNGTGFIKLKDFFGLNGAHPYGSLLAFTIPSITGFNPGSATLGSPVVVTLTGDGFNRTFGVSLNNNSTPSFKVISSKIIVVTIPGMGYTRGLFSVNCSGGVAIATKPFNFTLPGVSSITVSISGGGNPLLTPVEPTLQFDANILPISAFDKNVIWSVYPNNGTLSISGTGLADLTGNGNGIYTIIATSESNPSIKGMLLITVLGKVKLLSSPISTTSTGTGLQANEKNPCSDTYELYVPDIFTKYQWYIDGYKIVGATNYYYKPVINGNYSLLAIDSVINKFSPVGVTVIKDTKPVITSFGTPDSLMGTANNALRYQWYVNDFVIKGATNEVLPIYYNGNYTVTIYTTDSCKLRSDVFPISGANYENILRAGLIINDSTIENYGAGVSKSMRIYPNPTNGSSISIDLPSEGEEGDVVSGKILNSLGVRIQSFKLVYKNGSFSTKLDVTHKASGMYYIEVENRKEVHFGKVVIY